MDGVLNTTLGSAVDAPCTAVTIGMTGVAAANAELSDSLAELPESSDTVDTITALSADDPSVDGVLL
jgi:hypothetical protein